MPEESTTAAHSYAALWAEFANLKTRVAVLEGSWESLKNMAKDITEIGKQIAVLMERMTETKAGLTALTTNSDATTAARNKAEGGLVVFWKALPWIMFALSAGFAARGWVK